MKAEIGRAEHEQIQKHDNAHDAVRTAEGHAVKRDKAEAEADVERAGDASQSGWDDGYNNGYQDGHDDGYEEGYGFATSHQNNEQGESHE